MVREAMQPAHVLLWLRPELPPRSSGSAEEQGALPRLYQGCVGAPRGASSGRYPLAAWLVEASSSSSRAYATACSEVIALPSAQAVLKASSSSWEPTEAFVRWYREGSTLT